jgi:hypothetical protein
MAERPERDLQLGEILRVNDPVATKTTIEPEPVDHQPDGPDADPIEVRDLLGRVAAIKRHGLTPESGRVVSTPPLLNGKSEKSGCEPTWLEMEWTFLRGPGVRKLR